MSATLRVASYNIHACVGVDGRQDVDRVAGVLHEIGADVIGLQEVESRPARSALDQAQVLARALEMDCLEGPLVHGQTGWYGNALLTRRAVRAVRRVVFEGRSREARGAIVADLAGSGGAGWRVLTTHLDLHSGRRRRQFAVLLDQILPAGMPTIVIGDFNEWWPFSRGLSVLRRHAILPFAPPTFPSRLPLFALDRMALSACRLRGRLWRHDTALSRIASDHLPIWADVAALADPQPALPAADAPPPEEPAPDPGSRSAPAHRRSGSGNG
jgi:endonuclease/exonuclease/phosphatase family metal-dependent hydrolase